MKKNIDVYDRLYNSDLKHFEKNLTAFLNEKRRSSNISKRIENADDEEE